MDCCVWNRLRSISPVQEYTLYHHRGNNPEPRIHINVTFRLIAYQESSPLALLTDKIFLKEIQISAANIIQELIQTHFIQTHLSLNPLLPVCHAVIFIFQHRSCTVPAFLFISFFYLFVSLRQKQNWHYGRSVIFLSLRGWCSPGWVSAVSRPPTHTHTNSSLAPETTESIGGNGVDLTTHDCTVQQQPLTLCLGTRASHKTHLSTGNNINKTESGTSYKWPRFLACYYLNIVKGF